jgi:hypothetical protein
MFKELIKINKNGHTTKKKEQTFHEIADKAVSCVHLLLKPLLFFSFTSLLVGMMLSYLTLMLDIYDSILGKGVIFYIVFLLMTPSLVLLFFCRQLYKVVKISRHILTRVTVSKVMKKPEGGKMRKLMKAFIDIRGLMINYREIWDEFSALRWLKYPFLYYLAIISATLSITYIVILMLIGFGAGVWFVFHP